MSAPLAVVHAALSLRASYGGPARSIPALADALVQLGASVELVTAGNATPHDPLIMPSDPRVTVTAVSGRFDRKGLALWMPRFRRTIAERVDASRADVLHDHGMWRATNHAMSGAARALGLPLVVSPRGMLESAARRHRSARKSLAWALWARRDLARASCLHATSEGEATTLAGLGLDVPVVMIPNGVVVPPVVSPIEPHRAERQLLFIGRLVAVKGIDLLIEAWRRADPPGWRLVIAGPDEDGHRAVLERAVADAQLRDRVSFVGSLDEDAKWRALAACDALVLPSRTESFGSVVAEALAAARPVIATTTTPWAALATEQCGWLSAPTPDAIAQAITTACVLTDDATRAAMGARGRAYASRSLAWSRAARDMIAVYEWLARGGSTPASVRRP